MEHVTLQGAVRHENSPNCLVYEYPTKSSEMSIAVAEITDRYPEKGYAVNRVCNEMGYVLKGQGKLVTETQSVNLSPGDVVFIPCSEKFYWEGSMTVLLPTSPAWSPGQHEIHLCCDQPLPVEN
jgi:mannose-6-phosphate isomerase-like protein (cupin superfamily)